MRRFAVVLVLAAGCASESARPERERPAASAPTGGASTAADYLFLEQYSGKVVDLAGRLDHDRAIHGIVILDSGLRVYIPHFDQFARGDDWLKYVGNRSVATGVLHTWTRDIPGYHDPTLQITDFSGTTGE